MTFDVPADAYDRFMGRYSAPLAPVFADFAGVGVGVTRADSGAGSGTSDGARVLDVGCGPGALTTELVRRVGAESVAAVDPAPAFVDAARARHPGVDVRVAAAEALPFADETFEVVLAQLVVHFLHDPVAGLREMARVTRPGGVVAACVWDFEEGGAPLTTFWAAARAIDPNAPGEDVRPGTRRGHLAELFREAGLQDVVDDAVAVEVTHSSFDDWWQPYELGVGPVGAYLPTVDDATRDAIRARCSELLGPAPFTIRAIAWAVRGTATGTAT